MDLLGNGNLRKIMVENSNPQPLGGNQMPRFGGIATFMRLPGDTSLNDLDVAVVGTKSPYPTVEAETKASHRPSPNDAMVGSKK